MNKALAVVDNEKEAPAAKTQAEVERSFARLESARDTGIQTIDYGAGWCETEMQPNAGHLRHSGMVHAGVQDTIADHAAGAAASTLWRRGEYVRSVGFKLNLLRPGKRDRLRCRTEVLKPGRHLSIAEPEVYMANGRLRRMISKMTVTMAVMAAAEK